MVSTETLEVINYAKDLELEYNLKLFLLGTIFVYCIFTFWFTFKWDKDKHYIKFIKNFLIRIPFGLILFFYPLFSIILLRQVSWETFYLLILSFYSYSFIILLISVKLGIFEFAAELLGIKASPEKMKLKSERVKW